MSRARKKLGVVGVPGKMAVRVAALAQSDPRLKLVRALCRPHNEQEGHDLVGVRVEAFSAAHFSRAEVWLEFAHPSVTAATVAAAVAAKKPLVVCTTGFDDKTKRALQAAGKRIPVLVAANTSLGVAVLNAALKLALRALGPDYATEIVELHHDKKRDAPSGTALRLAQTIEAERNLDARAMVTGRDGLVGERSREEIGVFAVRGGNVIGEHTVYLLGADDRIELTHRAQSRDLFAAGALRAAAWLAEQSAGFYSMEDCLGLEGTT